MKKTITYLRPSCFATVLVWTGAVIAVAQTDTPTKSHHLWAGGSRIYAHVWWVPPFPEFTLKEMIQYFGYSPLFNAAVEFSFPLRDSGLSRGSFYLGTKLSYSSTFGLLGDDLRRFYGFRVVGRYYLPVRESGRKKPVKSRVCVGGGAGGSYVVDVVETEDGPVIDRYLLPVLTITVGVERFFSPRLGVLAETGFSGNIFFFPHFRISLVWLAKPARHEGAEK